MTGFGAGKSKINFGTITVEIKTLNYRYLEISTRIPESIQSFEKKIKNLIHKKIKRGRVVLSLNIGNDNENDFGIKINKNVASKYCAALKKLKKEFKIGDQITVGEILNFPEIIEYKRKRYDLSKYWSKVKTVINKALSDLFKSRKEEGRIIYNDLSKRVRAIETLTNRIKKRLPVVLKDKKGRFLKHLKGSNAKDLDDEKLKLDLAAYVRNSDITEEITRIDAHLKNFKNSLKSNDEIGRKLDFIAQELNREANTVAAKSQDYQISKAVIEVKAEIEKIREQVQNVE